MTTDKKLLVFAGSFVVAVFGWWAIWGVCSLVAAAVTKLAEVLK